MTCRDQNISILFSNYGDMNCLTVAAYFIESGRLFQSLGAAIENALSPHVVVDDLGTINSLLVAERKARSGL